MTETNFDGNKMMPGFWAAVILSIILALLFAQKCSAQQKQTVVYDTIYCNVQHIQKFVTKPTAKSSRVYAVYVDKQHSIAELIPVSKSVFEYVQTCKEYQITPNLGIKLKNGQIYSLVKLKTRVKWSQ